MVDILYIEDSLNDADIFTRLMRKQDPSVTYAVVSDGSEAIDFLLKNGQANTLPKLVLLDLNLNGLSGVEIVQRARSLDRTRYVPIVAFSTSDSPHDVLSAYEAGVNAYVVKPGSYHATGTVIGLICDFWLTSNTRTDTK